MPFFSEDEETTSTPKADAFFIPRENPRALIVHPIEKWPPRTTTEKQPVSKDESIRVHENGKSYPMHRPVMILTPTDDCARFCLSLTSSLVVSSHMGSLYVYKYTPFQ